MRTDLDSNSWMSIDVCVLIERIVTIDAVCALDEFKVHTRLHDHSSAIFGAVDADASGSTVGRVRVARDRRGRLGDDDGTC